MLILSNNSADQTLVLLSGRFHENLIGLISCQLVSLDGTFDYKELARMASLAGALHEACLLLVLGL